MSKHDRDETTTIEPSTEVSRGTKRLQLSVTRMKKLRSGVAGGFDNEELETAPSPGSRSWM
jgi:hypothetical protein